MALRPIPLNFQTLYADLAQNAHGSTFEHGSVVVRKRRGRDYLYVVSKDGASRSERYLGHTGDPRAAEEADRIRLAAEQARTLRTTVSALKQARIPAPSLPIGRVVEAVANAGLFNQGVVLIGTVAFQTYGCVLGYFLPGAALMTNDTDLLVASFVADGKKRDMEAILKRADPTFRAEMHHDDRLPKLFRSSNNLSVDILTKYGRGRRSPVLVDELTCSAEALTFMEYLAEESIDAVVLYGSGILVKVPPPIRFALHKLLIAQERQGKTLSKKAKDLVQARDLMDIFLETDSATLASELEDVRSRGARWKKNINTSLREIGRDTRQGRLPLPIASST